MNNQQTLINNQQPYIVILEKMLSGNYADHQGALTQAREDQLYNKWCLFLYDVDAGDTWGNFLNRIVKI